MLRYIILLLPIITACSKSENSQASEKNNQSKIYEIKTINKTIDDELSPLGHWDINLEYPILMDKNNAATVLNKKIEALSTQYSCEDNRGDKQFNASVTYANELVASIHFTDSWLCVGMPHQDGRVGSITFDRQSGDEIQIEDHLLDTENKNKLTEKITIELKKIITSQNIDGCPENIVWNQFYLTKMGINFLYTQENVAESPCEIEVHFAIQDLESYFKKTSILLIR